MARHYKDAAPAEVVFKAIMLLLSGGSLFALCVLSTFDLPGDPPSSCPTYWQRVEEIRQDKADYRQWDRLYQKGSYTKSFQEYQKEIGRK